MEGIMTILGLFATLFPLIIWIFIIKVIVSVMKNGSSRSSETSNSSTINNTRDYSGITRAGSHYHKGSVGTTRKDPEWEETRCGTYKDEIFGKDVCNTYTKPDYDSLTCEDEDLSGG